MIKQYYHPHKPKTNHKFASIYEEHTYKGSLIRHVAVENALILIAKPTSIKLIKNEKLYRILRVYVVILFGLNCNFPFKDIILYTINYVRGRV